MKNKISKYSIPLLAIIGIILSLVLTHVYYNANFVPNANPSFCSLNSTINCDAVAKTEFSRFIGVPLSIWGLGFYFLILFINFLPFIKNIAIFKDLASLENPKSYIFTLASISVLVSVILGVVQTVAIQKICILCCATYIVDIALLIVSKSGISFKEHYLNTVKDIKTLLEEPACFLGALILISILGFSIYLVNISKIFTPPPAIASPAVLQVPHFSNPNEHIGNVLGSTHPKVIIREYTDFNCPFCAMSNAMLHSLVQEVDGVQVIHNDFPLDKKCNSAIKKTNPDHVNSCLAALYARAARQQGSFWDYGSLLFDNQKNNLNEAKMISLAKSINLNTDQMKKYAHDPRSLAKLKSDVRKAYISGVHATPTYYIGMKKYEGLMSYPQLREIVLENMR